MPKDNPRAHRIADQIQRELADILRFELKDPRVGGFVTITDVEVTSDLAHAKVFFTAMSEEGTATRAVEEALGHAAGFLRSQLAQRMKLRVVPQLQFQYDASVERGMRLSHLIDEAVGKGGDE